MAEEMEGAVQQAAQPGLHDSALSGSVIISAIRPKVEAAV
jgi:hypothetical protein